MKLAPSYVVHIPTSEDQSTNLFKPTYLAISTTLYLLYLQTFPTTCTLYNLNATSY